MAEIIYLVNYVIGVEGKSDFSATNGFNRRRSVTVAFHRGRSALHFLCKISSFFKNTNRLLNYFIGLF
jgi:hypothetical protein